MIQFRSIDDDSNGFLYIFIAKSQGTQMFGDRRTPGLQLPGRKKHGTQPFFWGSTSVNLSSSFMWTWKDLNLTSWIFRYWLQVKFLNSSRWDSPIVSRFVAPWPPRWVRTWSKKIHGRLPPYEISGSQIWVKLKTSHTYIYIYTVYIGNFKNRQLKS